MSSADLVIVNGRVAVSSSLRSCAVAAKDGKVSWVGANSNAPKARKVIDASGLVVLPGVIDVHVHMRDPGSTDKEDFRSGHRGRRGRRGDHGLRHAQQLPPDRRRRDPSRQDEGGRGKALVDYAFYGLLTMGNAPEIAPMVDAGVIGFKCYMAETTGNVASPSEGEMREDLALVGRAGRRVSVHAEDDLDNQAPHREAEGVGAGSTPWLTTSPDRR